MQHHDDLVRRVITGYKKYRYEEGKRTRGPAFLLVQVHAQRAYVAS